MSSQSVPSNPVDQSSHPTVPLTTPPGYDMNVAQSCSFLVNVAVQMCEQWKNTGTLDGWTPETPCPNTGGFDVGDYEFGTVVWATFEYLGTSHTEPFAITATAGTSTFLAFRGTQTGADLGMDGEYALTAYTPPTSWSGSGAQVETGFNNVYQGLDLGQFWTSFPAGNQLIVAGHSLGSTLATLVVPAACAAGIPTIQYNQASPMVGNAAFASYYDSLNVATFRLVNTYDVVPTVPPASLGYVPVAPEGQATFGAYYADPDIDPKSNHDPCCCYSYALLNPENPFNSDFGSCMTAVGDTQLVPQP